MCQVKKAGLSLGGGFGGPQKNKYKFAKRGTAFLFSCRKSMPSELKLRKGALAHFTLLPRAGSASGLVGLAHQCRSSVFRRPLVGPIVPRRRRAACAVALVARASRTLVSNGRPSPGRDPRSQKRAKNRVKRQPAHGQSVGGKQTNAPFLRGIRPCRLRPPLSMGTSGAPASTNRGWQPCCRPHLPRN